MAFNGSGVFARLYNWAVDAAGAVAISSSRMDAEMDGMATGLSNCVTRDGQTTTTALVPFAQGISVTGDITATGVAQDATTSPGCGRASVVTAIQFKFAPFDGDRIQVDGKIYQIPSAGVTSANTGCFLNGVGSSSLSASTTYDVYVFDNSGTLTLDFRTANQHMIDTTSGNVGIAVRSNGGSPDSTRTLVAKTITSNTGAFQSNITGTNVTAGQIYTINWFNRRYLTIGNGNNNHQTTGSGTLVNISNTFSYVGSWGDNGTSAAWSGIVTNDTTGSSVLTSFSVDGVSAPNSGNLSVTQVASASYAYTAGMTYGAVLSEGFHYFGISASVSPNGIASILGIGDSLLTITIFG